jgi:hypothetical protein
MSRSGKEEPMTGHHQNRRLRRLAIRAALVTFLGGFLARPAAAASGAPEIPIEALSEPAITNGVQLYSLRTPGVQRQPIGSRQMVSAS